ncbi:metal ABC transporter permease [Paenibacillus terreus]|uniref:Metal ABC transporter permease n=1 Tax=Paenibacillus terreus TaxID=1387834 RepID=A0ABV5BE07_9BACL
MITLSANTQWVLLSTMMLGMAAGVIGCFAYWKRQSLMSDALSHAALPGVVAGFAVLGTKSLPVMLAGAALSALLGALFIHWIRTSSRVKEDAAMGIVLSVFFGLGIMLLTLVNRMPGGQQSGLDSFIFGQSASMVRQDVYTMIGITLLVFVAAIAGWKEWKLFLFDPQFAGGLGLSGRVMNMVYMVLLVLVIVIGIQAAGVILMAALLIIPGVSARYWTHSYTAMLGLAALFGGGSGIAGTLISAMGDGWPTGPFIVLSATFLFVVSLSFGSRKGLLVTFLQQRAQRLEATKQTTARESVERGG